MMNGLGWMVCVSVVCAAVICTLLPPLSSAEYMPRAAQLNARERRAIGRRVGNSFTLFRQLISQTRNETVSAYRQIRQLLADSVGPAPVVNTTQTTNGTNVTTSPPVDANGRENDVTTSTTAVPYRATSNELMTIFRRNFLGLRNLFKKELKAAVFDSGKNIVTAGKELLRPPPTTAKPG